MVQNTSKVFLRFNQKMEPFFAGLCSCKFFICTFSQLHSTTCKLILQRWSNDAWKKEMNGSAERKADSPLQRQSSRMLLISLAGKVRLRLRSASLTTICHSTPPPPPNHLPPPLLFAALGPAQFQPGSGRRRTGWGRRGGVGLAGVCWACRRGREDIVRG